MDDIKKALQEIAQALDNNETVTNVKIVITLKKQKPCKTKHNDK